MNSGASERTVCNLCGSTDLRAWFTLDAARFYNSTNRLRDTYTIARCGGCDLVFVKEIPSEEELKDVYGEGYYTGRDQVGYRAYRPATLPERIGRWIAALPQRALNALRKPASLPARLFQKIGSQKQRPWPYDLVDIVESHARPGRILDVGCASGLFMAAARESGWETKGVEFSDYSSRLARDERNLDVYTGSLRSALRSGVLQEGSFDVVALWDTAEHVIDPMAVFKDAWTVLKPGGLLFVKTLNLDSDRARAEGTGWHFFRPPKHLFYYSQKTLKEYLSRAGFSLAGDDNFANDVITVVARK